MKSLINSLTLAYGNRLPNHPGKWRIVDLIDSTFGLHSLYAGKTYEVRRMNLLWRLTPDCLLHRRLYYLSTYEGRETAWLRQQVRPDWVCLDIGANCGYYSMLIAQASGGTAEVHAFEPLTDVYALLEAHRTMNGFDRIHPHKMAVSDVVGEMECVLPPDQNTGLGRMRAEDEIVTGNTEIVPTTTIDAFVSQQNLKRLDFIKVDVEGAESLVLKGGEDTIRRFRPTMMVEVNPGVLNNYGWTAEGLLQQIRELGYDIFYPALSGLQPLNDLSVIKIYTNAICIPKK
jgi:FkbM family methyltransferase